MARNVLKRPIIGMRTTRLATASWRTRRLFALNWLRGLDMQNATRPRRRTGLTWFGNDLQGRYTGSSPRRDLPIRGHFRRGGPRRLAAAEALDRGRQTSVTALDAGSRPAGPEWARVGALAERLGSITPVLGRAPAGAAPRGPTQRQNLHPGSVPPIIGPALPRTARRGAPAPGTKPREEGWDT